MYCNRKNLNSFGKCLIVIGILLFSISANAAFENGLSLRFNKEFSLKKSSNTVSVYYTGNNGEEVKYLFKDFEADVLLYVYRRINQRQIINILADKYDLSETDCRRRLKMSVNTMESWSILQRI